MSDRRYSTAAWQRTRKAVLARDEHICRIRGRRCTGHATTVHHVVASSQRPDLFFAESNLVASCARCNFGGGAKTAGENRRRRVEQLEQLVVEQDQRIRELVDQVMELQEQHPEPTPRLAPQVPAIY